MRLLFSILLFCAFAIRPALEISAVLYYQLNIDYIVENYCINKERPALKCDGKCYLSTQLQAIDTSNNSENKEGLALFESFIPLFYQEISSHTPAILFSEESTHNWGEVSLFSYEFYQHIERPPIS